MKFKHYIVIITLLNLPHCVDACSSLMRMQRLALPMATVALDTTTIIGQKELSFSTDKKPVIATFGVASCIAVGIYNPLLQRVSLAHLDGMNTMEVEPRYDRGKWINNDEVGLEQNVASIIWHAMKGSDYKKARIYVFSGRKSDHKLFSTDFWAGYGFDAENVSVSFGESFGSHAVGIDAPTGAFFEFEYDHKIHATPRLKASVESLGMGWIFRKKIDVIDPDKTPS